MTKILVIHGAGMNMRGKVQVELFGPLTLADYDREIEAYAAALGITVETFHSNSEGEVADRLYEAHARGFDGAIVNPSGFAAGYAALAQAISLVPFPTVEVHISNPARRGVDSDIAKVCAGRVAGLGIYGYDLALRGLLALIAQKK
ncbi:MAG: type II 3-dehydroquinate dehydratase [Rhodospirillaceae bacterium]